MLKRPAFCLTAICFAVLAMPCSAKLHRHRHAKVQVVGHVQMRVIPATSAPGDSAIDAAAPAEPVEKISQPLVPDGSEDPQAPPGALYTDSDQVG